MRGIFGHFMHALLLELYFSHHFRHHSAQHIEILSIDIYYMLHAGFNAKSQNLYFADER